MLLHIYFFQVSEAGRPTLREVVFQEAVDSNKKIKADLMVVTGCRHLMR